MRNSKRRNSHKISALLAVSILASAPSAWTMRVDTIKANNWYSVKPAFKFLPGLTGRYQDRGWCTLRYHSKNKSLIFYEGYTRDQDCIYANSLYEFHPEKDSVLMRSISNWNCREHTVGPALAANATNPTPMDRHTYAQFAYVPATNKVYMAHGAMGNNNHQHDLWAWNFETSKWENLGAAPGGTQAWECICALNLIYSPTTEELLFFGSQKAIYAYKLAAGTWRTLATPKNASGKDIGGHGLYDPKRNVFAFYGNNWTENDVGSTTFLIYNPSTNAWTDVAPSGAWPPAKSYASMEYNSKHDLYMLHGGWKQNDTWIWNPNTQAWREVTTPTKPTAITNRGTYTAYSPDHDALVTYSANTMWFLRVLPPDGWSSPTSPGKLIEKREGSAPKPGLYLGRDLADLRRQHPEATLQIRDMQNRNVPSETFLGPDRANGIYILNPGTGAAGAPATSAPGP